MDLHFLDLLSGSGDTKCQHKLHRESKSAAKKIQAALSLKVSEHNMLLSTVRTDTRVQSVENPALHQCSMNRESSGHQEMVALNQW